MASLFEEQNFFDSSPFGEMDLGDYSFEEVTDEKPGGWGFLRDVGLDLWNTGKDLGTLWLKSEISKGNGEPATQSAYLPHFDPRRLPGDDYGAPYLRTDQDQRSGLIPTVRIPAYPQNWERPNTVAASTAGLPLNWLIIAGVAIFGVILWSRRG